MRAFSCLALLVSSAAASFTTNLKIKMCNQTGCVPVQKRVALDSNSTGTEKLIAVGGDGQDALTLSYGGASVGGPRVYLIEEEGVNKNTLVSLKGREFTFDVELSSLPCGFNAALYFIGMTENEGGAEKGTNYCDAQAVTGTFCSEMDILEANTKAQQFTTHACIDACGSFTDSDDKCKGAFGTKTTVCDQSGCGFNPFRYGPGTSYNTENNNDHWYGDMTNGTDYELDSSKVMKVVTQFHADPSSGELINITRFYIQKGKRIDLPTVYTVQAWPKFDPFVNPAIRKDFCKDIYDRWNGDAELAPLAQMGKNMENGMVLAMSAWYSKETYSGGKPEGTQTGMSWLDGVNNWQGYKKAGPCHETTTDNAGPYHATFSDIRVGDIGTTGSYPPAPPSPAPPSPSPPSPAPPSPPSPSPSKGQCCFGGCSSGNCQGGWCGASRDHCTTCSGKWCSPHVVV